MCRANCFDLSVTAHESAAFAGILAGFAFAAIVLFLSSDRGIGASTQAASHALEAFVVAFAGLLLSTFMYGAVAGEIHSDRRAALGTFLSGDTLAISLIALFVGLVLATRLRERPNVLLEFVAAVLVPSFAFAFVGTTAIDALTEDDSRRRAWGQAPGWIATSLIAMVPLATLSIYALRRRLRKEEPERHATLYRMNAVNLLVIVVTAALAIAFDERPFNQGWPTAPYLLVMIGVAVAMVANTQALATTSEDGP